MKADLYFEELLVRALAAGVSLETALAEIHASGATPVDVIKAIRAACGVSLAEAKQIFGQSPAWAQEVKTGDLLHEEIVSVLSLDRKG